MMNLDGTVYEFRFMTTDEMQTLPLADVALNYHRAGGQLGYPQLSKTARDAIYTHWRALHDTIMDRRSHGER
jgi:hypothetical protein